LPENKKVVELVYEKSTKNTFRFMEPESNSPPVLRTLYVQKYVFGGKAPEKIKVTIEW